MTELKKQVLEAAKRQMTESAKEFDDRIKDLRSVTTGDDNAESASQTESTRGGDVELMNSLTEQRDHVNIELKRIEALDPSVKLDVVQYGAVVHTENHHFLVATSIEEFDVNGTKYLGVSTLAPLIKAMSGAKKGEIIDYQGKTYIIKEIA